MGNWLNEFDANNIYQKLGDQLSKDIFTDRLFFSVTSDLNYITNIVKKTETAGKLYARLADCNGLILFGTGYYGRQIKDIFPKCNWKYFFDNKDTVKQFDQLERIDMQNLVVLSEKYKVLITPRYECLEIRDQLLSAGCKKENLIFLSEFMDDFSKKQYFDLPQLKMSEKEVFVDCGSYDLSNSEAIMDRCKHIYAYEPDYENYKTCLEKKNIKMYEKISLYHAGVFSRTGTLKFVEQGTEMSAVSEEGEQVIPIVSLDESIYEEVTFIKMDIEGAELEALKGARKTISKSFPNLAISVYHRPEDIIAIPQYIAELCSEYRFYLRHYNINQFDTVLYAVNEASRK